MSSADLATIGERLRTQDNRITENPMFCVQEQITKYGMDRRWSDDPVWIDCTNDSPEEVPPPKDGRETPFLFQIGKLQYWQTVMVAFTEVGCQEYLKLNGHNHRGETRIYVESFNRCPEMIAIREALISTKGRE
jgi:hypothetical protein